MTSEELYAHACDLLKRKYAERNVMRATECLSEAANQGHKLAQARLMELAEAGEADAQYRLGTFYLKCKDEKDLAAQWLTSAAWQGHKGAIANLCLFTRDAIAAKYDWLDMLGFGDDSQSILFPAVEFWKRSALENCAEAQFCLGLCYENGFCVENDMLVAITWLFRAAKQGHRESTDELCAIAEKGDIESQYRLALCYENGWGCDRDEGNASEWFGKAARQGHSDALVKLISRADHGDAEAQYQLGLFYDSGSVFGKNKNDAAALWHKSASKGHIEAQYQLALCYEEGEGKDKDVEQAAMWYGCALRKGCTEAFRKLGALAKEGISEACFQLGWYYAFTDMETINAVERANNPPGEDYSSDYEDYDQIEIAKQNRYEVYCRGFDYDYDYEEKGQDDYVFVDDDSFRDREVCNYLGRAVQQGHTGALKKLQAFAATSGDHPESQYLLGRFYAEGIGTAKDSVQAVKWFSQATEQQTLCIPAYLSLGNCYAKGEGVDKNICLAINSWRVAARHGDREAMYQLGLCYANGDGVDRDMEKAVKWWRKANLSNGNYQLGLCYAKGDGVDVNMQEAVNCWKRAGKNHAEAQYQLGLCYEIGQGTELNKSQAARYFGRAALIGHKDAVKRLFHLVDEGYVEAKYYLACCYSNGVGVSPDINQAIALFVQVAQQSVAQHKKHHPDDFLPPPSSDLGSESAKDRLQDIAQKGNAEANYQLGSCYENGWGDNKDDGKAAKWFGHAAQLGHSKAFAKLRPLAEEKCDLEAQYQLGLCYKNGLGVQRDYSLALKWLEYAAQKLHRGALKDLGINFSHESQALYGLGLYFFEGRGGKKDIDRAIELFRRAAEDDNEDAKYYLGLCYKNGWGVELDRNQAVKWFSVAVTQGQLKAFYELQSFATDGDAEAQCEIGDCYYYGHIEDVGRDLAEAVKWYTKSAEQGYAAAQYSLGECYAKNDGVVKDLEEAAKLYTKAAEQGHAAAQFELGECYLKGYGVFMDTIKGVSWLRKAAEQEYPSAQYRLAECYQNGIGVEKDDVKASQWRQIADSNGEIPF